jgi:hypothetical protein
MTNKEFVSQIAGLLKLNNKDNRIPKRLILKVGQDAATFLISQKWGERSILTETSLYTHLPCFEFKKIDVKDCPSIEFRLCKTLMKSKKPLPKLIFSKLGSSIRDIVSLDGDFTFTYVDETQYRRNKKRKYKLENDVYIYLGTDNHLYIPDQEILSLDLTVLTLDTIGAADSCGCKEKNDCLSYWDYEFKISDKLLESIKNITLEKLGMTRNITEDNNLNGLENA